MTLSLFLSFPPSSSALSFFFSSSVVVCRVDEFPHSCCCCCPCCHRTIVRELWQTITSDPRGHRQAHPLLLAQNLQTNNKLPMRAVRVTLRRCILRYDMLCYAMYVGSVSYRKIVSVVGDGERERVSERVKERERERGRPMMVKMMMVMVVVVMLLEKRLGGVSLVAMVVGKKRRGWCDLVRGKGREGGGLSLAGWLACFALLFVALRTFWLPSLCRPVKCTAWPSYSPALLLSPGATTPPTRGPTSFMGGAHNVYY